MVNTYVGYKTVTVSNIIVAYLGGNLFVQDPLYVISWYITFVLFLYLYVFVDSLVGRKGQYLLTAIGFLFFSFITHTMFYFVSFYIGLRLHKLNIKKFLLYDDSIINRSLFLIQKYCYSFFLLHGGVLHFIFRTTHTDYSFVFALTMSIVVSIPLYEVANFIQNYIMTKIVLGVKKNIT